MKKNGRIRNQQFNEERFMGKSFKGRSWIGRQNDNTMQMGIQIGIQNKSWTKQYSETQDQVIHKKFSSSARSRLYGIIFTSHKYVNHFNIITHNITHGRLRMDMRDVWRRSSISKRWAWNTNVLGMAGINERTRINHRRRRTR